MELPAYLVILTTACIIVQAKTTTPLLATATPTPITKPADCPPFPDTCPPGCYVVDAKGCKYCHDMACRGPPAASDSGSNSSTSASGGSLTGQNNNGCPPFPTNCDGNCVNLDNTGCPVCTCSTGRSNSSSSSGFSAGSLGGGSGSGGGASSVASSSAMQNLNGCPAFPTNCDGKCVKLDQKSGCPVCTCTTGSNSTSSGFSAGSLGGGTGSGGGAVSSVSSSATQNLNGCPAFPTNCGGNCVQLDKQSGCPICTCTMGSSNSTSSGFMAGSLSGTSGTGSATSSASSSATKNNNGCPVFTRGCPAECTTLDASGCPVCTCSATKTGTGSSTGTSGSVATGTSGSTLTGTSGNHQMSSGASANANGCPLFQPTCPQECVTLDGHGCPICICAGTASSSQPSISGTGTGSDLNKMTSSQMTQQVANSIKNGAGCPVFYSNCPGKCVSLDDMGCPICTCSSSGSNSTSHGSSSSSTMHVTVNNTYNNLDPGSMKNVNGCPQFRQACPAECTTTNAKGCPVCTCKVSATDKFTSEVVCAPLDRDCNTQCMYVGPRGCVLCNAACKAKHPSTGGSGSTFGGNFVTGSTANNSLTPGSDKNVNGCPDYDVSCPARCTSFDSDGCLTCTCSTAASNSTDSLSGAVVVCPAFDPTNCKAECMKIAPNGCLICTCDAPQTNNTNGGGSSAHAGNINSCPAFDTSCPIACADIDSAGCIRCTCTGSNSSHGGNIGPGPGSSNGSVFPGGCVPFDTSCPRDCIHLDSLGCLSCTCEVTTQLPVVTSTAPAPTAAPTAAPAQTVPPAPTCPPFDQSCPMTCAKLEAGCLICDPACIVTTTEPSTTRSACPSYDVACPPWCTSLDTRGCLVCSCGGGVAPSTSPGPTAPPTAGTTAGCPVFDESCTPGCASLDARGCLHCDMACSSPVTTAPPVITTAGCPAFDESCPPGCAHLTAQGCLQCDKICAVTIPPTTNAPSTGVPTTTAQVTTTAGVVCPTFDASCPTNCINLDSKGCLRCICAVTNPPTTTAPTPAPTTTAQVTTAPTTAGVVCPNFDASCPLHCINMDSNGCLRCICAVTKSPTTTQPPLTTTFPNPGNKGCPTYDATCPPTCAALDANMCLVCTCAGSGSGAGAGSSGQVSQPPLTTFAPIAPGGPGSGTGTGSTGTGSAGSNMNGCAPFDESCPPGCAAIDAKGCLSCTCSGSGSGSVSGSVNPVVLPQSSQAPLTTFAPLGPGSGNGSGTGSGAGQVSQPPLTTFAPLGPVSGIGSGTGSGAGQVSQAPLTTFAPLGPGSGTGTGTGAGGSGSPDNNNSGCPGFDVNCPAGCASIDAKGCLSCSCSAQPSTNSPVNPIVQTQPPTMPPTQPPAPSTVAPVETTSPWVCPKVRCLYPCNHLKFDARGCPVCECRPTTSKP